MTKQEHIQYWIDSAAHDWTVCQSMFEDGHYDWSLFLAHLVIEKLLKALWVKSHPENAPPRIHLLDLLAEQAGLQLADETLIYLRNVNSFWIEARYPDQKFTFQQKCTREFAQDHLKKIQEIQKWLQSQIKS